MPYSAVLFDLDGTLADTLDDIADAMNHALVSNGLPPRPRDEYRALVGEGVERLVDRALPPGATPHREPVLDALRAYYLAHMLDRTVPYPGIPELLDALTERGVPMAVLSNKPAPATTWMVERLFGRWPFAAVVGGDAGRALKPDPAALLEIAALIGVPPGECLFVGDTRTDMETAVAAGMVPAGALWGFRDRDELLAHGARALLAAPLDVLDLLDGRRDLFEAQSGG